MSKPTSPSISPLKTGLSPDPLIQWMISGPGRGPQGEVASWVRQSEPAFWYPEVGGYALSLFSFLYHRTQESLYLKEARKVASWLQSVGKNGAYGRDECLYVFDSGMILKGFLHYLMADPTQKTSLRSFLGKTKNFLANCFEENISHQPYAQDDSKKGHWSRHPGPHLLKAAGALFLYGEAFQDGEAQRAAQNFTDRMTKTWEKGWLWEPNSAPLYLHAQCYALEGLLLMESLGLRLQEEWIQKSLGALAQMQDSSGGLPSHAHPHTGAKNSSYPYRGDTVTQALRLWTLRNAPQWRPQAQKALTYLSQNTHLKGAVLYEPDSEDLNLWATSFLIQTLIWQKEPADPRWLI